MSQRKPMEIIEFFEELLEIRNLSPVQKMCLKAIRGEPLDDKNAIVIQHQYQNVQFANEIEMFKYFSGKKEYATTIYSDTSLCWGRRCLEEGTEVLTPNGPVPIQDLKIGDLVYGFEDGVVKETKVLETFNNGLKEVVELVNSNKKISASTEDHVWLTSHTTNGLKYLNIAERSLKDCRLKDLNIERRFVKIPCGTVKEPHAYAIGALLGDGCSRNSRGKNDIWISSQFEMVPEKLGKILGADVKRNHPSNYNWMLRKQNIHCNYYSEWLKDRYAHEKIVDFKVIDSWDRETCLEFMAGLVDTDGSVFMSSDTNNLNIQFGCQALPVVEAYVKLFYKLWHHKLEIHIDTHKDYKNGPVFYVNCKSNLYSKMAVHELNPYLVNPSRKWKSEYSDLPEQRSDQRLGIKLGKKYSTSTYDIHVANSSNLYLLANEGLITHNSGKSTTIGAGLAIYFATQFDYRPYLGTSPHATIPIISPTKEQAGEVYAAIKQLFLRSPVLLAKFLDGNVESIQDEYDEDDLENPSRLSGGQIKLNNKVIIKVMAADMSKMRGFAAPFVILDEVCFFGVEGNDTKNTDKAIYEALAPALSQFTQVDGMALVLKISSPNGQAGLMYDDFEKREDPDTLHLQVPSWYANPSLGVKYLEKQKKKGMSYFNREYGAQYTASETSYLDPELIEKAIIRGIDEIEPMDGFRYVAAMDYATKDDYWAFAIGHKEYVTDPESKEKVERVQIDFTRSWRGTSGNELDPSVIIPEICMYLKRYRVNYCVADQYAFAALKPLFGKEGCNLKEFKVSHQSKLKYMYSLQVVVNSQNLKMVHDPLAVKHLKDLREKRSSIANKIKIEHAQNCHDDLADCIGIIVYQFDKTSPLFVGMHYDPADDRPETKDALGRQVLTPTAEDLAQHVGLNGFYDNRLEHDQKKNEQESEEKDDASNNFWFIV